VDDRDALLQMLERTLVHFGLRVSVAHSADEALALVKDVGMPDLLVTDVVMPGSMDGVALADNLRARKAELAVLLISGYTDSFQSEYVFLQKPFSMAKLEQSVAEALEANRAEVEPA